MELNSNLFFKTKFEIVAKVHGLDLLKELVLNVKKWMLSKYGQYSKTYRPKGILSGKAVLWESFQQGGRIFSSDEAKTLFMESEYVFLEESREEFWACQLVENQKTKPGFAPRKWTTEIGYERHGEGKATVSIVLYYTDIPGFIGPCEVSPDASVPKLIKLLLEDMSLVCSVEEDSVNLTAFELRAGDFEWFHKLVMKPERKIPIVYISPQKSSKEELPKLLLSPDKLASQVATNALIYYAQHPDANEEMGYYFDKYYRCQNGMVRIYMGQINSQDRKDYSRHRYFTPSQLLELGESQVLGIFRRVLAQDIHFYQTMFRLDDCRQKKQAEMSRRRLESVRNHSEEVVQRTEKEKEETIKELNGVVQLVEKERDTAKGELQKLRQKNFDLDSRLGYYQSDAEKVPELERALEGVRAIAEYPKGSQAIGAYFETVFADRLVFSEDGRKSLEDCTTKDEVLWEALFYMSTTLYDLYNNDSITQIDKEFKNRTGWDLARGEGTMTRKNSSLIKQYFTEYEGREVNIQSHVKNGVNESDPKFIRVYFGYDQESKKLVVGQCGKHKENYTSSKVK